MQYWKRQDNAARYMKKAVGAFQDVATVNLVVPPAFLLIRPRRRDSSWRAATCTSSTRCTGSTEGATPLAAMPLTPALSRIRERIRVREGVAP
jgi:hypothetical protein